jgi:hypothetical protein
MIGTVAYAGRVLEEWKYLEAADRAARFVLENLRDDEGRLLRTHRDGRSKIRAFLDDHALLADAMLELWEATFDPRWLDEARSLAGEMNRLFADDERGGWYRTAHDAEELITRTCSPLDGALPGGNAVATRVMLRLAALTGDAAYRERADAALRRFADVMTRAPSATLGLLTALDDRLHEDGEIAIVGRPKSPRTRALMRPVHAAFLPGEDALPWLAGKTLVGGSEAVYICRNYTCRVPVTDHEELEDALRAHRPEIVRAGSPESPSEGAEP